jgi:hypothetical protein
MTGLSRTLLAHDVISRTRIIWSLSKADVGLPSCRLMPDTTEPTETLGVLPDAA